MAAAWTSHGAGGVGSGRGRQGGKIAPVWGKSFGFSPGWLERGVFLKVDTLMYARVAFCQVSHQGENNSQFRNRLDTIAQHDFFVCMPLVIYLGNFCFGTGLDGV